jgi:hypothetical protein
METMVRPSEEQMKKAESAIRDAILRLEEATDLLVAAAEDTDGLPVGDRIMSLKNDVEDLWCDLMDLKRELREEEA